MADQKISTSPEIHINYDSKHSNKDPEIAPAQEMEDIDMLKDHMNYDRVDKEVARYASDVAINISSEENSRLKSLVDKRVLAIMIFTYFLQALDKGTMSFASIMKIRTDTHLVGQQFAWLTTCIYIAVLIVEYPTNRLIQRRAAGDVYRIILYIAKS